MDYYLTETIFIRDNQMYLKEYNKEQKVTKNNWHIILQDYGWEKLPLPWIKLLNKLSTNKSKNSKFGMYDCDSDGNCFFQCIANSFNEKDRYKGEEYNHSDIRNLIADSITEDIFKTLLSYYRIMKDADDFDEEWDPYKITTIDEFKEKIKETGHSYWGDYLLLNLIIQQLKLNIMILNCNDYENNYTIYNTLNEYNPEYNSIFLLYEDNCHFKLIGHFNNNEMISYFDNDSIPEELNRLFKLKK